MRNPVIICANSNCKSIMWKGQRVWHKGRDLYCCSKCLIESFTVKPEKKAVREKSTRQERVEMMREIYARRKRG